MNYNVEQKRHWRYWVWKRIARNCGVHPRFATVLFLAGPSPLDLEAAKKYGFRLENIVAVDVDEDAVKNARAAGCTAIQGDLHEVVCKWDDGVIHGIVADYCCGLTLNTAVKSYQLCGKTNVAALNFQRGREHDEGSRNLRSYVRQVSRADVFDGFLAAMLPWLKHAIEDSLVADDATERELSWDTAVMCDMTIEYIERGSSYSRFMEHERRLILSKILESTNRERWQEIVGYLASKNERMSYRSNAVIMDSLIVPKATCVNMNGMFRIGPMRNKTTARMSAMKAIRTMNGAVRFASDSN